MRQLRRGARFAQESLPGGRLERAVGGQQLDGHAPLQAQLAGEVNQAHPAVSEGPLDDVPPGEGALERGKQRVRSHGPKYPGLTTGGSARVVRFAQLLRRNRRPNGGVVTEGTNFPVSFRDGVRGRRSVPPIEQHEERHNDGKHEDTGFDPARASRQPGGAMIGHGQQV